MDFVQPAIGLANFDRVGFEAATFPIGAILLSCQFKVEVAPWAAACYLSG